MADLQIIRALALCGAGKLSRASTQACRNRSAALTRGSRAFSKHSVAAAPLEALRRKWRSWIRSAAIRYLHTMVRVRDLEQSLKFYRDALGLVEVRRIENEKGRFTLIFLAAPGDEERARSEKAPMLELTYNWDPEDYGAGRNFGHLAFLVDDIYAACSRLQAAGVTINRPPRDGCMAFVRSPDRISIELLQKGEALPPKEPWASMPNTGSW